MAGLYIHIPFCRQKCHYCNFYTVISQRYRKQFISALKHELELQKYYLENQQVNTIYFGGGTPSMLSTNEIISLIDTVSLNYNVNSDVEITLEANPDDLSSDFLRQIKNETPVNRFSIGVQSFYDDDLAYLNRIHNGKHARNAIYEALKLGFNNLTIDLIYGIPT
ncbi:MAG: radical SAM protein, partial [Bacteroidetes bacterium]|nr:radical SAM protein [Bacteroidota bacterium]